MKSSSRGTQRPAAIRACTNLTTAPPTIPAKSESSTSFVQKARPEGHDRRDQRGGAEPADAVAEGLAELVAVDRSRRRGRRRRRRSGPRRRPGRAPQPRSMTPSSSRSRRSKKRSSRRSAGSSCRATAGGAAAASAARASNATGASRRGRTFVVLCIGSRDPARMGGRPGQPPDGFGLPASVMHDLGPERGGRALEVDGPRGEGEVGPELGQAADEPEVDLLLDVHEQVVVGAQDVIHHFIVERRVAEAGEVGAVEAGLRRCPR